jgi:Protein of unknown function (DUF3667)/Domain of unknown function (DUF4286)
VASAPGPVYEVSLSIDREAAAEFDAWLASHVREMLELPGFVRAVTFSAEDDDPGRVRRITQYFLEDDEALEAYLSGPAEAMRQEALLRFPDRFVASRRVLHHADTAEETSTPVEACRNCGTLLTGQYCTNCGQRARTRLISIWELVRDAVGDLFELDSRLWQTLIPLTVRPGQLTRDYLMGRRARFMPPFRTYLVLSLAFFLVAFFDPGEQLGLLLDPVTTTPSEVRDEARQRMEEGFEQAAEEFEAQGMAVPEGLRNPPEIPEAPEEDAESGINVACETSDFDDMDLPQWFEERLTPERMKEICRRVTADEGRAFIGALTDNIPASLFILLPLMALALKVLYPLSKRYYAEHLLFVVHYHAFLFLVLTLDILFTRLVQLVQLPGLVSTLSGWAVAIYIPVYLFKALRRVYGQGRAITFLKFLLLVMAYLFGLVVILLFVLLYTAMSL